MAPPTHRKGNKPNSGASTMRPRGGRGHPSAGRPQPRLRLLPPRLASAGAAASPPPSAPTPTSPTAPRRPPRSASSTASSPPPSRLAGRCPTRATSRLKPGIDFQYTINAKGSSPAEILGTGYKTVLKQGLVAHADVNKRIRLANLEEVNDLQKQMQGNVKALEGERNNISSLQATNDNMVACLNSLDREMTNDDSRFTSEARQMNDELEKKKNSLISVEMQADDFFKISEKRLQDARLKADEETQVAANKLRELVYSMAEHKEFMETIIAQRRKDLHEAEDYIASLASR